MFWLSRNTFPTERIVRLDVVAMDRAQEGARLGE
jgi:hypothetical protein